MINAKLSKLWIIFSIRAGLRLIAIMAPLRWFQITKFYEAFYQNLILTFIMFFGNKIVKAKSNHAPKPVIVEWHHDTAILSKLEYLCLGSDLGRA